MRRSIDCTKINSPRQIAGIDYKLVVAVFMFFGFAALMFKSPSILVLPVLFVVFLRGPAKNDPELVKAYLRHRIQKPYYTPTYVCAPNNRNPRPPGFSRLFSI